MTNEKQSSMSKALNEMTVAISDVEKAMNELKSCARRTSITLIALDSPEIAINNGITDRLGSML
jgi:hypothetical protein